MNVKTGITVKARLRSLIASFLGLLLLVGVFGVYNTYRLLDNMREVSKNIELARSARSNFALQLLNWKSLLIHSDAPEKRDRYFKKSKIYRDKTLEQLWLLDRNMSRQEVQVINVKKILVSIQNMNALLDNVLRQRDREKISNLHAADFKVADIDARTTDEIQQVLEFMLEWHASETQAILQNFFRLSAFFALAGAAFCLLGGLWISRGILFTALRLMQGQTENKNGLNP